MPGESAGHRYPGIAARVGLLFLRGYQIGLSPWLGSSCRFDPSCSAYAADAIRRFGLIRGSWLGMRRIARCHPWGDSGSDPVPTEWRWWGRSREYEDPAVSAPKGPRSGGGRVL